MKNRRSTAGGGASPDDAAGQVHATRRAGARVEISARVTLASPSRVLEGWALNVSRGGVRVILEESVRVGEELDVTIAGGAEPAGPRRGRVVWVQDEPDGVVAGLEFRVEGGAPARGKS